MAGINVDLNTLRGGTLHASMYGHAASQMDNSGAQSYTGWKFSLTGDPTWRASAIACKITHLRINGGDFGLMDNIFRNRGGSADWSYVDTLRDNGPLFCSSGCIKMLTPGPPNWLNPDDPNDQVLFGQLCLQVAQHFEASGANGPFKITYWDAFNEPQDHYVSNSIIACTIQMAKALKGHDASYKVGGLCWAYGAGDAFNYAQQAVAAGVPPDFYSYHVYLGSQDTQGELDKACQAGLGFWTGGNESLCPQIARDARNQLTSAGVSAARCPIYLNEYNFDGNGPSGNDQGYFSVYNGGQANEVLCACIITGMALSGATVEACARWDLSPDGNYTAINSDGSLTPVCYFFAYAGAVMPGTITNFSITNQFTDTNQGGDRIACLPTKSGTNFAVKITNYDQTNAYGKGISIPAYTGASVTYKEFSPASPNGLTKTIQTSALATLSIPARSIVILSSGGAPPPSYTESAEGTSVTTSSGPTITDASGNVYSISAGAQVLNNGQPDTTTANVIELFYHLHQLYQENTSFLWYTRTDINSPWQQVQSPVSSSLPGNVGSQTVGTITSTSIAVSWTAPAVGGAVANYIVQTSPAGANAWTTAGSPTATSFVVTGLSVLTVYDIRIAAQNPSGTGSYAPLPSVSTWPTNATFFDDFTAPAIDWARWSPEYGYSTSALGSPDGTSFHIDPTYAPTAALGNPFGLSSGILTINANVTPRNLLATANNLPYTSGLLQTQGKFSQTYGYFECRAKICSGAGTIVAFWLLPETGAGKPELDIFEIIGNQPDTVTTTQWWLDGNGNPTNDIQHLYGTTDLSQGFHTYGLNWQADYITTYLDGVQIYQQPTNAQLNVPMFIIYELGTGDANSWQGAPQPGETWPQTTQVDYIVAYQAMPPGGGLRIGPFTESVEGSSVLFGSGSTITDASGNVYGISSGAQVTNGGVVDTTTLNVAQIYYHLHNLYHQNTGGLWYYRPNPATAWIFTSSPVPVAPPPPPVTGTAIAVSTAGNNATGTSVVVSKPSGGWVSGNLLIATVTSRSTTTIPTTPSGWTLVGSTAAGTTLGSAAFRRTCGASEPASYTFAGTSAAFMGAVVAEYSGANTTSGVDTVVAGAGTGTTATFAAVSTRYRDETVLLCLGVDTATETAIPTGFVVEASAVGNVANAYLVDADQPLAGTTGTPSITLSASAAWTAILVALVPVQVVLTASPGTLHTYALPTGFNPNSNAVEVIAGGGGASNSVPGMPAGGGAYSRADNLQISGTAQYQIGSGGTGGAGAATDNVGTDGGQTWFGASTYAAALVAAMPGTGGSRNTGSGVATPGMGGLASGGIGSLLYSGGNGGIYDGVNFGALYGGGGAAAGPFGAGGSGAFGSVNVSGVGGGGSSGGETPPTSDGPQGGRGGDNGAGIGGGTGAASNAVPGAAGTNGGGGGGGWGNNTPGTDLATSGGNGGNGGDWITAGAGGGGGSAGGGGTNLTARGGDGGLYGGGGGPSGYQETSARGGNGAQGCVVVTFKSLVTPPANQATTSFSSDFSPDFGDGSGAPPPPPVGGSTTFLASTGRITITGYAPIVQQTPFAAAQFFSIPFFAVELTAFRPGSTAIPFALGHGTRPHGTFAELPTVFSTTSVIRASDLGYRTRFNDPLPTMPYPPIIDTAFQVSRALNMDPAQSGAGAAWGTLSLDNANGEFDAIVGSWNSDGRPLNILVGSKIPDAVRRIYLDPPYSWLAAYFVGMATQWTLTETQLQVPIRDATYWLERPLQTTLYLGTGGLESPIPYTGPPPPPPFSTSLQGQTKPKTRGGSATYPVRNVTPVLVDPVNLIYQYTDAAGTVVSLYEGGAAVFGYQGDVTNLYAGTTGAGNYRTNNARGLFQLGSTPVNAITCDVTGAFPNGMQTPHLGGLVENLLLQDLNVPPANIDLASFTAFISGYLWQAGVFFASEGTSYVPFAAPTAKSIDGVAAISATLAGTGVQLIPSRDGTLKLLLLSAVPPNAVAVAAFDTTNVVSLTPKPLPTTLNPPPFRMRVGYQHNYTVQQSGALSPAISGNALQFVQAQDRYAASSNNSIILAFQRPNDPSPVTTCLLAPNDAQAAANSLMTLWGRRRRLYDMVVPFGFGAQREIGDVITLRYPLDNLTGGLLGQIVGEQFNSDDPTMTLTVLI